MHNRSQRVHRLAVDQDFQFLQFIGAIFGKLVIQRGVALGARLQLIEEVHDQLRERDGVIQLDAVRGRIFRPSEFAAPPRDHFHDGAVILGGGDDFDVHPRLADFDNFAGVGQFRRGVDAHG